MIALVTILFIFAALLSWFWISEQQTQRRRVLSLIGAESALSEKSTRNQEQAGIQKDIAKKLAIITQDEKKTAATLRSLIAQTGIKISVKTYWIYSSLFALAMAMLGMIFALTPVLLVLIFALSLFFLPKLFLKMKAAKRQKLFLGDFADALEAMVRLLKAGMPVSEAVSMIATEFRGPVGEEMSQIYEQQKIGVSLSEATLAAAKRMPIPEMHMLATGINIQAKTGSSLSEALMNLANLIRARHRLKRKVIALSSEATISAGIIGALPIFVGAMLYLINPDYTGLLFTHPVGKILSAGAAIWMMIGIIIMKQMINFKV